MNRKTSNLFYILLALLSLVASTLACAERTFTDLHVYSSIPGAIEEFYDQSTNKILQDNVWVFRSDGTYSAIINIDGERMSLAGKYGGDDVGDDFLFSIDIDNDGTYDDTIFANDDFTFIEWRRESGTLKYFLSE